MQINRAVISAAFMFVRATFTSQVKSGCVHCFFLDPPPPSPIVTFLPFDFDVNCTTLLPGEGNHQNGADSAAGVVARRSYGSVHGAQGREPGHPDRVG